MSTHLDNPDYDGYETMGTDGEYTTGMAESSADYGYPHGLSNINLFWRFYTPNDGLFDLPPNTMWIRFFFVSPNYLSGGITQNESDRYRAQQQQFDRASIGSGATEDGDDLGCQPDYGTKSGDDDGRYPEKAQLEEAGYRLGSRQ